MKAHHQRCLAPGCFRAAISGYCSEHEASYNFTSSPKEPPPLSEHRQSTPTNLHAWNRAATTREYSDKEKARRKAEARNPRVEAEPDSGLQSAPSTVELLQKQGQT